MHDFTIWYNCSPLRFAGFDSSCSLCISMLQEHRSTPEGWFYSNQILEVPHFLFSLGCRMMFECWLWLCEKSPRDLLHHSSLRLRPIINFSHNRWVKFGTSGLVWFRSTRHIELPLRLCTSKHEQKNYWWGILRNKAHREQLHAGILFFQVQMVLRRLLLQCEGYSCFFLTWKNRRSQVSDRSSLYLSFASCLAATFRFNWRTFTLNSFHISSC